MEIHEESRTLVKQSIEMTITFLVDVTDQNYIAIIDSNYSTEIIQ